MAKSLNTMSVSDAFAAYNNTVILDGIGGKNTKDDAGNVVLATTYTAFVPESVLEYLGELRTYANNNWDSKANADKTVEAKLAWIVKEAETFVPKTPRTQTPLRRAVQNLLCRMHPEAVQGLNGSALQKALAPDVERFLVSASLEKYRAQIEAEIASISAATSKRATRDGSSDKAEGLGITFDMDVPEAAE